MGKKTTKPKLIVADYVYAPLASVDTKQVKKHFVRDHFDTKGCMSFGENRTPCEYVDIRPCNVCKQCPNYGGTYKFYTTRKIGGKKYVGLARGRPDLLKKVLGDSANYRKVDKRIKKPMRRGLKFTSKLRDYQVEAVDKLYAKQQGMLVSAPRTGKCLVGNTLINTSDGWVYFNELEFREGYFPWKSTVDGPKGNKTVSHSFKGRSKTIKITTHNGFSIEGTPEHKVLIITPDLKLKWRKLSNLSVDDHIVSRTNKNKPIYPNKDIINIDEAKILGWMTANGSRNVFSSGDDYVLRKFIPIAEKLSGHKIRKDNTSCTVPSWHILGNYYRLKLEPQGFISGSRNKVIPESIRRSSLKVLKAFLSAYFECDSGTNGHEINLISASKRLINELHIILNMQFDILGTKTAFSTYARNSKNPTVREYYKIRLVGRDAARFCNTFPTSKAARMWQNREEIYNTQECTGFKYIPYVFDFINSDYQARKKGVRLLIGEDKATYSTKYLPTKPYRLNGHINLSWWLSKDWYDWYNEYECISPSVAGRIKYLQEGGFRFERVVNIQHGNKEKKVYDLTVPNGHAFTANGLTSHNTVMSIALAIKLGMRVLIMAHQDDLLKQFHATFYGTKQQMGMTNAQAILDKTGRPPVVIANKAEDFFNKDHDVVLTNYQKFISEKGEQLLKRVVKEFAVLIIDEVHRAPADAYNEVLSVVRAQRIYGLTATPKRKDRKEFTLAYRIGKILHRTEATSLQPEVIVQISAMKVPARRQQWVAILKALYNNAPRNKDIVNWVMKDLKAGHNIVIPVASNRKYCEDLSAMINKAWLDESGDTKLIAAPFYAYSKSDQKEKVLEDARSGKLRVIVAMRSMLTGVNVPRWSAIYEIAPINNPPNFEQETQRVCTPFDGKPDPIIRFFVDLPTPASVRCFLASLRVCRKLKYHISKKSEEIVRKIQLSQDVGYTHFTNTTVNLHRSDEDSASIGRPWKRKKRKD